MSKRKQRKTLSYIERLKFNPKLLTGLPGKYFTNIRLMILVLLSILVLGFSSLSSLPKTLNPEVDIPFFVIQTVLPGGTPTDLESQVTEPIEKELKKIKNIDTFQSSSQENVSVITIEFTPNTEVSEARNDLQVALDASKQEIPDEATEPALQQVDFEDAPVWTFGLVRKNGDEDYVSLMRLADKIKDEIEDIDRVSRVSTSGIDEREIHILIKPEAIKEKGVSVFSVMEGIRDALKSYPAGSLTTDRNNFSLVINQQSTDLESLREIMVEVDEQRMRLMDIAQVTEQSKPNQFKSFFGSKETEKQNIVRFSVYKTKAAHIDKAQAEVEEKVNQILDGYQGDFEVKSINNYANEIDEQLSSLGENFMQTLGLVFVSMLLLYGMRQSMIAAIAIPFTLLITFIAMKAFGFTINFLSIYSLLIGLGLFTDNAVVIIEGFTSIRRSRRFDSLESALLTWQDYASELFSINILTVWSFLPLLTMSGIMGEFIKPLPIIVSVAMMASVFIALMFTLPSMMIITEFKMSKRIKILLQVIALIVGLVMSIKLIPKSVLFLPTLVTFVALVLAIVYLRKNLKKEVVRKIKVSGWSLKLVKFFSKAFRQGFVSLDGVVGSYRKMIEFVLERKRRRNRILITIGIFTVFSYLLVPFGFIKSEFFPKSTSDRIYVGLDLPLGTNATQTEIVADGLMTKLNQFEEVEYVMAEIGNSFSDGFNLTQPDSNNALFTLFLIDEKERDDSLKISKRVRQSLADFNQGKVKVIDADHGGPPAGADLEIQLIGDDLTILQSLAGDVEKYLDNLEGATNTERSIKTGKNKIVFEPNKASLARHNIAESQIGFTLRTYANGLEAETVNFDDEERKVMIRVSDDLLTPEELSLIEISNKGVYTPLSELGKFYLEPNPNVITRFDGRRTLTVTAAAQPNYIPVQLNQSLVNFAKNDLELPEGYDFKIGGSNEMSEEANASIYQAMIISIILITTTLVIQLGSFRRALIVILVIPLAISGVFIFFALTATPLSMPAMMGVLSLFGIVIANSLMIVDKVGKNLRVGFNLEKAIVEAGATRLEPILLTSAAQVIGLIPTTLADPIWRGFGGAIIAGLSFSGVIMLFFIPVVYYYFFPELRSKKKI